ncbi:hypothetical protein X777_14783 [Ooceraea biroi]|uniref:Uncharacterized protein n=1 Tax=Ooceraea biroi TaxID=2015173 RepID=A0A026WU63_OOCBI|nr:hypothetical protein X777_14783 [Ooceraea biroi]
MATLRGAPATSSTTRLPADAPTTTEKRRKRRKSTGERRGTSQIVDDVTGAGNDNDENGVMEGRVYRLAERSDRMRSFWKQPTPNLCLSLE